MRADSADPQQVADLFAAIDHSFGRIDVLVNNAGMLAPQSRLEDLGFERMQRIFAVNSIGPILCAQQAVKRMSYRHNGPGGVVINVSSASARLGSPNEYVDYAASKGALETFTIGFAKEVAREGMGLLRKAEPTPGIETQVDLFSEGSRTRSCYVSAKFTPQAERYYQFRLTSDSLGNCRLYASLIERDKEGDGWHLTPNLQVTCNGDGPTSKTHYNNGRFEDSDYHPPEALYPGMDIN